jgi:hypothetical protein
VYALDNGERPSHDKCDFNIRLVIPDPLEENDIMAIGACFSQGGPLLERLEVRTKCLGNGGNKSKVCSFIWRK